jgi:flagellar M-ring protein FliF
MLTQTNPNSQEALSAAQFDQVRRQETSFNARIRELLEPLTGPGRVNAEVAVDLDFSVSEEARETFLNDPAKVRAEQVSQTTVASGTAVEGIPGAVSNTPPGPAATAAADPNPKAPVETASSATRNFEMDRTLQHTRQPAGRIRRVTAAVLVDNVPKAGANGKVTMVPLDQATLTRIEALVKQAVGFNAERGDSVSVMNAAFVKPETMAPEDVPLWENPLFQNPMVRDIARFLLGTIVVLVLLFAIIRPALRQIINPSAKRKEKTSRVDVTVVEPEEEELGEDTIALKHEVDAETKQRALASDAYEDRLRNAREAVKSDSKQVAQVVKDWVAADD